MKYFKTIILAIFFILPLASCGRHTLETVQRSVNIENPYQAAERLRRCAGRGEDQITSQCKAKLQEIEEAGITPFEYYKRIIAANQEKERLQTILNTPGPWGNLMRVNEIIKGNLQEEYPGQINKLLEDAFFGFGECAKEADVGCMVQYARMILDGSGQLGLKEREEAKRKALYWLNIAARYGSQEARKSLIALNEEIPTPDLAMEQLQISANQQQILHQQEERRLQREMINNLQQIQLQNSMQYLFPRIVNCTTNTIGSTTYTRCY